MAVDSPLVEEVDQCSTAIPRKRIWVAHVRAAMLGEATTESTPAVPSTSTRSPSRRRRVTSPVVSTAGMPYSRAITAAWASALPSSVMTAPACKKSRDQWRGRRGDEHVAVPQLGELGVAANDTDRYRVSPVDPGAPCNSLALFFSPLGASGRVLIQV